MVTTLGECFDIAPSLFNRSSGTLGGDAGLGRTLLSAPLQGKGHVLPQAWAKLVTCELPRDLILPLQVWPKPAQGPIHSPSAISAGV